MSVTRLAAVLVMVSSAGVASIDAIGQPRAAAMTTESGVRIEFATRGVGATATPGQVVILHYVGTIGGAEFDSSRKRGEPYAFSIGKGQAIKGFDEAFRQLRIGDKVVMVIPPELAYGDRGFPPLIPPNATLEFRVEVLAFEDHALADAIAEAVDANGVDGGKQRFEELKRVGFAGHYFSESHMNKLGQRYLRRAKVPEALAVLEWNASLYPKSGMALDRLAAALETAGQQVRAEDTCRRALLLDPGIRDQQGSWCPGGVRRVR